MIYILFINNIQESLIINHALPVQLKCNTHVVLVKSEPGPQGLPDGRLHGRMVNLAEVGCWEGRPTRWAPMELQNPYKLGYNTSYPFIFGHL